MKWVNDGQTVHDVSTTAANAQNPKDTSMPKGATPFDSGFIPPGGDYQLHIHGAGHLSILLPSA